MRRALLAITALLVILVAVFGSLPTSARAEEALAMETRLLALVNEARITEGLPPLGFDAEAQKVAQLRAEDMAERGYFSHEIPPTGRYFNIYLTERWFWAAENLGRHCGPPEDVLEAWMGSEGQLRGHRDAILDPCAQRVGFGHAYAAEIDRHYYVLILIARIPVNRELCSCSKRV